MPRIAEIVLSDALVAAARAGEFAALASVYAATVDAIYTLLRRLVRRPAIAEDLLQETFVDVLVARAPKDSALGLEDGDVICTRVATTRTAAGVSGDRNRGGLTAAPC
jgi:hypothetical protein